MGSAGPENEQLSLEKDAGSAEDEAENIATSAGKREAAEVKETAADREAKEEAAADHKAAATDHEAKGTTAGKSEKEKRPVRERKQTESGFYVRAISERSVRERASNSESARPRVSTTSIKAEAQRGAAMVALTIPGPQNAKEYERLLPEQRARFDAAKAKEDNALVANGTYELVTEAQVPRGQRIYESRYVWTIKVDENGNETAKSRLTVMETRDGPVKKENYAPVASRFSARVIYALCAQLGMKMYQIDENNAFLHGKLDEPVYVRFPRGYAVPEGCEGKLMKLKKSLYGLQRAPKIWNETFTAWMKENGWSVAEHHDKCVFFRRTAAGGFMLLGLHVDDEFGGTTRAPADLAWFEQFMQKLEKKFGIKVKQPKYILGTDVHQDSDTGDVCLTQHTYIKKILQQHGADVGYETQVPEKKSNTKLISKAIGMGPAQRRESEERLNRWNDTEERYRSMVGALIHATHTRPDIAHAVGLLARLLPNGANKEEDEEIRVEWTEEQRRKEEEKERRRQKEREDVMRKLRATCSGLRAGRGGGNQAGTRVAAVPGGVARGVGAGGARPAAGAGAADRRSFSRGRACAALSEGHHALWAALPRTHRRGASGRRADGNQELLRCRLSGRCGGWQEHVRLLHLPQRLSGAMGEPQADVGGAIDGGLGIHRHVAGDG
jgi:hypothetical protein